MDIIVGGRSVLLTYCTNVHPSDDLASLAQSLDETTARVARAVCPDSRFGLGLRLGEAQLAELTSSPAARARFDEVLTRNQYFVFTINGFAQTPFHERRVKESVYRPDWTDPARTRYTLGLAGCLAGWLPADDRFGTISTVPIGWRKDVLDRMDAAASQIWSLVGGLARLEQEVGAYIMV